MSLKGIITLTICIIAFLGLLLACSEKTYTQTTKQERDTVDIRLVPVEQLKGSLEVGQTLSIPNLDIELVRVSEKEVLVKTPVRTETRTETKFVLVKKVDKSRTYTDSFNKDKSRTDTGNRTKVKTKEVKKDKQVSRNSFPWWLILIALLLGTVGWAIKNRKSLPFLRWLPF